MTQNGGDLDKDEIVKDKKNHDNIIYFLRREDEMA